MLFQNNNLTRSEFLSRYWQHEPVVIRQAFPDFTPELDSNDIAGLACEELAESRLISGSYPEHNWALHQGPFDEKTLSELPEENWTLLVQDAEKHYPPLDQLFNHFSFLPRWRFDDLMISVASPGGSVGPHVDQYDVFLLQASGTKRWSVARAFNPELRSGTDLNVLQSFEPEQEWVLESGDMLYLPPNVAHHGVALDTGMTWSFGMRAPSSADLLLALGEWLAEQDGEGARYQDGKLDTNPRPGEVNPEALSGFSSLLRNCVDNHPAFQTFAASFLSRYRLAYEPASPARQLTRTDLHSALGRGALLRPNPWTRLLWIREDDQAVLFAAGTAHPCSIGIAEALCTNPVYTLMPDEHNEEFSLLALTLLNTGHLFLEDA